MLNNRDKVISEAIVRVQCDCPRESLGVNQNKKQDLNPTKGNASTCLASIDQKDVRTLQWQKLFGNTSASATTKDVTGREMSYDEKRSLLELIRREEDCEDIAQGSNFKRI